MTTSFILWVIFGVIGSLILIFSLAILTEEKKPIYSFNFFTLLTTKKGKGRRTITTKKQVERV